MPVPYDWLACTRAQRLGSGPAGKSTVLEPRSIIRGAHLRAHEMIGAAPSHGQFAARRANCRSRSRHPGAELRATPVTWIDRTQIAAEPAQRPWYATRLRACCGSRSTSTTVLVSGTFVA
jgi:hypothetical protein